MHVLRTWMDELEKVVISIVVVTAAITFTSSVLGLQQPTVISVCQNKACCQRWKLKTPLPDTLHDLIINNNNENQVTIDVSSCLGQCDKGPNLRIASGGTEVYCNGIDDPIGLITLLDDTLSMTVSSKLLAAVTVFEKAQTGTYARLIRGRDSGRLSLFLCRLFWFGCIGCLRSCYSIFVSQKWLHFIESPTIELSLSVRSVLLGAKSKRTNIFIYL